MKAKRTAVNSSIEESLNKYTTKLIFVRIEKYTILTNIAFQFEYISITIIANGSHVSEK